jgi:hypothetical protein
MAAEASILAALNAQLASLVFSPSIPVSYPNIDFTPPAASKTAKYLRVSHLPADTFAASIGKLDSNKYAGLYQVDVFIGNGAGEPAAIAIAEQIIAKFKRGTRLTKNNFTIEIQDPPSRLPYLQDAETKAWWMLPVRVAYVCYAKNPA